MNRTALLLLPLLFCAVPIPAFAKKTISVRIFVDEEERRKEQIWKETLVRRLEQASSILGQHSQIKFSVTKFGSWDSEDGHNDFPRSLKEFEQETNPKPAELAIGFTSQYTFTKGRSNLGGTRGPMRRHILIREGTRVQEVERLEVLTHELAHYLGAAHSPDQSSVMRPILGDGQSRARAFRIKFDMPNARIVSIVSGEMANRNVQSMHQLSIQSKVQVRDLYAQIAKGFPEDEVAGLYVSVMDRSIRASVAMRQKQLEAAKRKAAQKQQDIDKAEKQRLKEKSAGVTAAKSN